MQRFTKKEAREMCKESGRVDWVRVILTTIQTGALLTAAVVAPNAIGAMAKLGLLPTPEKRYAVRRTQTMLETKGYLTYERGYAQLTKKGKTHLEKTAIKKHHEGSAQGWDGKWRIVMFDIPEQQRSARIRLIRTLKSAGFIRFQKSAWLTPYQSGKLVQLLKADLGMGSSVAYIVAEGGEWDTKYRQLLRLRPQKLS